MSQQVQVEVLSVSNHQEMQVKPMSYHLTLVRTAGVKKTRHDKCWEGVMRGDPSCTVGGDANRCSHYGKQDEGFPKQLNMELPYDPAIPLFGIYPGNETTILKRYLHPMFGTPLLSISKTWKQPKCLLIDE